MVGQRAVLVAEFSCREHISSIGAQPSDQSECMCRSPLSAARISPPPRSCALERNSASASGSRPAHACAITLAVLGPMPGRDCQLLAAPWRSRSASESSFDDVGGVAVGHHPPRVFAGAVLVVRNLAQGDHRIHALQRAPRGRRNQCRVGHGTVDRLTCKERPGQ